MAQDPDIYFSPRWLSLRQATGYCPIGQKALIRLAKESIIIGGQHGGTQAWFFDRYSIDEYMKSMCINNRTLEIENKAVEFFKRLR